jgi:hypothetical protein
MLKKLMSREEFDEFFKEAGRQGGLIGGPRAAAKMTAEQRRARAQKAARARWGKKKSANKKS